MDDHHRQLNTGFGQTLLGSGDIHHRMVWAVAWIALIVSLHLPHPAYGEALGQPVFGLQPLAPEITSKSAEADTSSHATRATTPDASDTDAPQTLAPLIRIDEATETEAPPTVQNPLQVVNEPTTYQDEEFGFQLTLPDSWIQVPDSVLRSAMSAAKAIEPHVNYATNPVVFQRRGEPMISFPCMVVQTIPMDTTGKYPHIKDWFINTLMNETVHEQLSHSRLLNEAQFESSFNDAEKVIMVRGYGEANGKLFYIDSIIHVGQSGLVLLNLYTLPNTPYDPTIQAMLETFHFQPGSAYRHIPPQQS